MVFELCSGYKLKNSSTILKSGIVFHKNYSLSILGKLIDYIIIMLTIAAIDDLWLLPLP